MSGVCSRSRGRLQQILLYATHESFPADSSWMPVASLTMRPALLHGSGEPCQEGIKKETPEKHRCVLRAMKRRSDGASIALAIDREWVGMSCWWVRHL